MSRPLMIVFCIPGREFSGRFLDCWNDLVAGCNRAGISYAVAREYDPVVYYARNKVLGGNVRLGPKQEPWGGKIPYDFMLWIDSDVIFTFQDLVTLITHNVDMVSGLYVMQDGKRFPVVEHMDEATLQRQGEFEYMTLKSFEGRTGLVPVGYSGFGFTLVKKGVFERLTYPWFRPVFMQIGEVSEFTSEDVGFCILAKKAGVVMHIDPTVIVGHEKSVVLRA